MSEVSCAAVSKRFQSFQSRLQRPLGRGFELEDAKRGAENKMKEVVSLDEILKLLRERLGLYEHLYVKTKKEDLAGQYEAILEELKYLRERLEELKAI